MVKNEKYGSIGAGSDISNLIITSSDGGNWASHGSKIENIGGVNMNVEFGYIYFDITD